MTARRTIAILSIFGAACLTPAAMAANWVPASGQDAQNPTMIFTETDNGAALLARSQDGKFIASLSNDGTDFAKRMKAKAKYSRGATVALEVGERAITTASWRWMPAIDTVLSTDHLQAAKIFNASVRGEPVSISVDGKPFTTLNLPKTDETFSAFASTCKERRNKN
jgi:hypothetical protein